MKVAFSLDGDLGHFLAATAAIERFATQNPNIKIDIAATNEDRCRLLQGAWFINNAYPVNLGDIPEHESYDFIHSLEADIVTAKEAELKHRSETRERIDQMLENFAKQRGVDPSTVAKPELYDKLDPSLPPMWNLVQGYAHNISDSSGWRCEFPNDSPAPWSHVSRTLKDRTTKLLIKCGIRGEDFVVIDKYDWIKENGGDIVYPDNWKAITTDGLDEDLIIGLVANPRCKLVVGPTGGAVYTAWTYNKPLLEINQSPATSYWDSCRTNKGAVLAFHNIKMLEQTMATVLAKHCGIIWEN